MKVDDPDHEGVTGDTQATNAAPNVKADTA
jgi:hypothetical protein